jgi:hypothetical protein
MQGWGRRDFERNINTLLARTNEPGIHEPWISIGLRVCKANIVCVSLPIYGQLPTYGRSRVTSSELYLYMTE